MNGAIDMFFYEQSLLLKMKQAEIEANAKDAWKWNKTQNKVAAKQSCCNNINIIPQACCQA